MFLFRSWIAFLYGFFGELFSRMQPCYVITPTRENKENICSSLGVQDYCETFDEHNEEITAD